jgi:uncharacterized membrane protein
VGTESSEPTRGSATASRDKGVNWRFATLAEVLTAFGATSVTFMMIMYALERRHRRFVLAFAAGCVASSIYGFLAGTWPFGVVEALWAAVALRRYLRTAGE